MNRNILVVFFLVAMLGTQVFADTVDLDKKVFTSFRTAVGDKSSIKLIDESISEIEDCVKQGYDPIKAKIRITSMTSVKAGIVFMPNEKMDIVNNTVLQFNKILKEINKKENKEPYLYDFYAYRGMTFSHFPDFLGKGKIALQDLEKSYQLSKKLGRPQEEAVEVYLNLAKLYKKNNEKEKAKQIAEEILAFPDNLSEFKKQAQQLIKEN